ncbi:hypothetical protein MHYP_G00168900 [Metynnis hypsauchen]
METFSSKDLAMKAQKKFLSHMASKSMAQMMVDDTSGEVLDELYRVSKLHTGNRAEAQKVLKNLVKVAVKVAILIRHDKFSKDELKLAQEFRKKLHNGAMTAISFQEHEQLLHDMMQQLNLLVRAQTEGVQPASAAATLVLASTHPPTDLNPIRADALVANPESYAGEPETCREFLLQ